MPDITVSPTIGRIQPEPPPKLSHEELVAGLPNQAWEQAAYTAITHVYRCTGMAERIDRRLLELRLQQDNEQWHLLIVDEQIARSGVRESSFNYSWIPQAIAFGFYQTSWLMYLVRPAWSYRLAFTADYGEYDSMADVFRQIGHDERVHKLKSEADMAQARLV